MWEVGHPRLIASILVLLLFAPLASSLVMTPPSINLTEFNAPQESIVTILNNDFNPVKITLTPDAYSYHLSPYISYDPREFILEPNEQRNVRVSTNFPSNLTPQNHVVFLHAYPGAKETTTLFFRPPGTAQPVLRLVNVETQEENTETLLFTVHMKNLGNVHLYATPEILVFAGNESVKDIKYQQPILIMAGEEYTLTLRQSLEEFDPGAYRSLVSVRYVVDDFEDITEESVHNFFINERVAVQEEDNDWQQIGLIALGVTVLLLIFIWAKPKSWEHAKRQREIKAVHKEIRYLRAEVQKITNNAKHVMDEVYKLS